MRLVLALAASFLLSGAAAAQQEKVWTPAPVPGDLPPEVAPADRAGSIAGPDTSTPFSGLPSGMRTGAQTNQTLGDQPNSSETGTPNLSR